MSNVTLVGLRCAGKSYILNKCTNRLYSKVFFDEVLDEEFKNKGGLEIAIKNKTADGILNNYGPQKIMEILSQNNHTLLELSAGAIIGPADETNRRNLSTIIKYSQPISIFPTRDHDAGMDILFEREQLRGSDRTAERIREQYFKFLYLCLSHHFEMRYSDEDLNWVNELK